MEDRVTGTVDGIAQGTGLDEGRAYDPLQGGPVDGAGQDPIGHMLDRISDRAQGGHEMEITGQSGCTFYKADLFTLTEGSGHKTDQVYPGVSHEDTTKVHRWNRKAGDILGVGIVREHQHTVIAWIVHTGTSDVRDYVPMCALAALGFRVSVMHVKGQSTYNNSGRSIVAIVLAGGSGTRFSDEINKVYVPLADRTVMEHSLDTLDANPLVDAIQVVVRAEDEALWAELSEHRAWDKLIGHVVGGGTRHESEWAGLQAIAPHFSDDTVVLMHDAARPFLTHDLIDGLVAVTKPGQGGVPAHSLRADVMADDPTLTTGNLVTVQTPQAFVLGDLLTAYEAALPTHFHAVDTSQTLEEFSGVQVMMVPSDPRNIKITRKADLDTAQELLKEFDHGQWLVEHT